SGLLLAGRTDSGFPNAGIGIELDAIAAVIIGGASFFGGRGTVVGTVIGLCLIQALKNGLSLAGVKGDGTIMLIGAVIILAILASNLFERSGTR
ncbi:MAG: ABC transporter permease, partial [Bauldia sp.]